MTVTTLVVLNERPPILIGGRSVGEEDEIQKGEQRSMVISWIRGVGANYADGTMRGKPDFSPSYDNFYILRGILWQLEGRDFNQPITSDEAESNGLR
ncbi:MAG: hypothetical protein AAF433_18850 [Bacteroidota bacterium]